MKIVLTTRTLKSYKKLPLGIKLKAGRQLKLLQSNIKHSSLRVRKMSGIDRFEARIDHHCRITFSIENNNIFILSMGPHDEGLGKK